MNISLDALQVIDTIARKGSFAAAANALFRVPSAITYNVRKLEEDLGVKIFDRNGHKATLTPAGEELLAQGRTLLQAASELERRVKRLANGVETELNLCMGDAIAYQSIWNLVDQFYQLNLGTRIKISQEVYGGVWDSLIFGRSDIVIGAPGDCPMSSGINSKSMGILNFVFAVHPQHPLAQLPEPLKNLDIVQYRSIVAADSSRTLVPLTSGVVSGQDVLTVPTLAHKVQAQIAGLGVGYLPEHLAREAVQKGQLIIKQVAEPKPDTAMYIGWNAQAEGQAHRWWLQKLQQTNFLS